MLTAIQYPLEAIALHTGKGKTLSFMGVTLTFKAVSADTDGAWALMEYTAPPHFPGPGLHWHKVTREGFYVLEGTLTFRLGAQGGQVIRGAAGAFVHIPPGVVHAFSNEEDTPTRFLTFLSPGGLEQYFVELVALAQSEPTWPPKDMHKLAELRVRYDQYTPDELSEAG